jgi:hypothetical protein
VGAVLRFPTLAASGARKQTQLPAFAVDVQALDAEGAARLLGVVRDVMARVRVLVEYLDGHRQEARKNGAETIVIELSAIMEGGRLQDIEAALEEASRGSGRPEVTLEGFGKLRRAERLVMEAEEGMARFRGPMSLVSSPAMGCSSCGMSGRSLGSFFDGIPTSVLILSIIGAGALAAGVFLYLTKESRR